MNKHAGHEQETPHLTAVRMLRIADDDSILAARLKGERLREPIEVAAGIALVVVLDFEGVEVVTPSFFVGGPWALWERNRVEQYPLVANLPQGAVDDLELVATLKRNPIWVGKFSRGIFQEPSVVGDVETTDNGVLVRTLESGAVTAADMARFDSTLGITGWNNRLAGLWQKKVLARRKLGRMFQYFVPWKESWQ